MCETNFRIFSIYTFKGFKKPIFMTSLYLLKTLYVFFVSINFFYFRKISNCPLKNEKEPNTNLLFDGYELIFFVFCRKFERLNNFKEAIFVKILIYDISIVLCIFGIYIWFCLYLTFYCSLISRDWLLMT